MVVLSHNALQVTTVEICLLKVMLGSVPSEEKRRV